MTLRIAAFSLLLSVPASVRCAEPIDFEKSVRPILQKHCVACHGAKRTESGLRLDRAKRALAGGDQDVAIVPGKPDESPLLMRLRSTGDDQMPPEGPRVSDHDIAVLSAGIRSVNCGGGAVADDFDGDGDFDLLTSTWDPSGPMHYFENEHKPYLVYLPLVL